ncbi:hypothetical protein F5B19DRAFT_477298 [Rostrohypoxylon terebratum]|nr:hypothetical protein F5B19DRAFT_477298 [Rostrohypoxylon terebratum]
MVRHINLQFRYPWSFRAIGRRYKLLERGGIIGVPVWLVDLILPSLDLVQYPLGRALRKRFDLPRCQSHSPYLVSSSYFYPVRRYFLCSYDFSASVIIVAFFGFVFFWVGSVFFYLQ